MRRDVEAQLLEAGFLDLTSWGCWCEDCGVPLRNADIRLCWRCASV